MKRMTAVHDTRRSPDKHGVSAKKYPPKFPDFLKGAVLTGTLPARQCIEEISSDEVEGNRMQY
jgi:hypothetical protein